MLKRRGVTREGPMSFDEKYLFLDLPVWPPHTQKRDVEQNNCINFKKKCSKFSLSSMAKNTPATSFQNLLWQTMATDNNKRQPKQQQHRRHLMVPRTDVNESYKSKLWSRKGRRGESRILR